MLKVTVTVPEASIKAIKKAIDRKIAEVVAKTATLAYSYIVEQDRPFWSGEYLSSWNVSFGSPKYIHRISAGFGKGRGADIHYARLKETTITPNYSNPYQSIYISNAANHAMKVEYEGTPTHPNGGWFIAAGARNRALNYQKWLGV